MCVCIKPQQHYRDAFQLCRVFASGGLNLPQAWTYPDSPTWDISFSRERLNSAFPYYWTTHHQSAIGSGSWSIIASYDLTVPL